MKTKYLDLTILSAVMTAIGILFLLLYHIYIFGGSLMMPGIIIEVIILLRMTADKNKEEKK